MTGDEIVLAAQQYVSKHGESRSGPEIRALMDAVADTQDYSMDTGSDQGYIKRKFSSERIESNNVIDYPTLISKFWSGVFKYLMKASSVGSEVEVRDVSLISTVGIVDIEVTKHHGRTYKVRSTRMSAIAFLRLQGTAEARKYLNECYKHYLRQECQSCGLVSSLGPTKEFDTGCAKCGSMKSEILARVMRRRERRCECGQIRPTNVKRMCGHEDTTGKIVNGCGGTEIAIVQAEELLPNDTDHQEALHDTHEVDSEAKFVEHESERDVKVFMEACIRAMPSDRKDPTGDSQGRKILRILTDTQAGAEVCNLCYTHAAKVCIECKETNCEHEKVPDPKVCCGSSVFSLTQCINYSKRIGEFTHTTASLANRRTGKVRAHVIEFAKHHTREFATARAIVDGLKE